MSKNKFASKYQNALIASPTYILMCSFLSVLVFEKFILIMDIKSLLSLQHHDSTNCQNVHFLYRHFQNHEKIKKKLKQENWAQIDWKIIFEYVITKCRIINPQIFMGRNHFDK